MLKTTFIALLKNYSDDEALIDNLWHELEQNYSGKKRFYHTLLHLENLLLQLNPVKEEIHHWDALLFTLYYHDAIYNSLKADNEEKSAELAEKRMQQLAVPTEIIDRCKEQILATKSHHRSTDSDTNYFTDADLSVLGENWETYSNYLTNVREEYSIYPDMIYKPGRKKVLNHFLAMDRIYKTDYFYNRYEKQAKENLQKELDLL